MKLKRVLYSNRFNKITTLAVFSIIALITLAISVNASESTIAYSNVESLEIYENSSGIKIISTLPRGEEMIVENTENSGNINFYKISCGNISGYVKCENITSPLVSITFDKPKNAQINAENVNHRAKADMDSEIISHLKLDSNVQAIGIIGDWVKVRAQDKIGYVHKDFIKIEEDTNINTSLNTNDKKYTELKMGVSGKAVVEIQKALAKEGLFTGDIDGIYDSRVREAVKQFQEKNGLDADGKASEKIQKMLFQGK